MRRVTALVALLTTSCATMEPKLGQPEPAIPMSWPAGDATLKQSETGLPVLTYRDIFRDPRLQALIAQALINNRDLMAAASNIAAAREQYHIQRAQQFPQVDAQAGATVTGERSQSNSNSGPGSSNSKLKLAANYNAGISIPSFDIDLFGRLRSLTHAQFQQYLATEAGARATRLTLVANIGDA